MDFPSFQKLLFTIILLISLSSKTFAETKTWDFYNATNYLYDNLKIEMTPGLAKLKASTLAWYNPLWKYRRLVLVNNSSNSSDLINYQIKLLIDPANFDRSKLLPSCGDIRITDSDGTTDLNFWIENYFNAPSDNSTVWVKVPLIPAYSIKQLYIYYGLKCQPDLKFGVTTDEHGLQDTGTKMGSHALAFISAYVDQMNNIYTPDFSVELGDKVNNIGDDFLTEQTIGAAFDRLNNTHYFVNGNHDIGIGRANLHRALGIDYDYKSVDVGNYHIITLDTEEAPLPNYACLGHISDTEKAWLISELAKTHKKTIIFCHHALDNQNMLFSAMAETGFVDNAAEIRSIIENDGDVIAVFQGHLHWDNLCTINNVPYITLNSLVEDASDEWAEAEIINNQFLNLTCRLGNNNIKKVVIWDLLNKKLINSGASVFDLYDDFDGDSGRWTKFAGNQGTYSIHQGGGYLTPSGATGHRLLKSNYTEKTNYIAETRINIASGGKAGFASQLYDMTHFNALFVGSDGYIKWMQMKAGAWNLISQSSITTDTLWHDLKLVKTGTTYSVYYDGNYQFGASNSNLPDASLGLWIYQDPVEYDNLHVRGYTSIEPTCSVGAEEANYDQTNPTISISPDAAQPFTAINGFTEIAVKDGGEIKYQISRDAGANWLWWNDSEWTTTSAGYSETNTAGEINSNIRSLPGGIFSVKAYLHSDGSQLVQLNSMSIHYNMISIIEPLNNGILSGTNVDLSAITTSTAGMAGVQFYCGATPIGPEVTTAAAPNIYTYQWDTKLFPDGNASITAVGRNILDEYTTSTAIMVRIDNTPPHRSNGLPTGKLAIGTTSCTLCLQTDEAAICKYSEYPDTPFNLMTEFNDTGDTFHSTEIDDLTDGSSYVFYVKCQDNQGNINTDDIVISFSVDEDTSPPAVNFVSPSNHSTIGGRAVTLTAVASDNIGVTAVQFDVDGDNTGLPGAISPYSITLDSTALADGVHIISADASDAAGNYATSSVSVTVDNTGPVISGITANNTTETRAIINWSTDELSNSRVEYGESSYTTSSTLDSTPTTSHSITIDGLNAGTPYHYRVYSADPVGNGTYSSDHTLTTTDTTSPTVTITQPSDGAIVRGSFVILSAAVFDHGVVTDVQFVIDGLYYGPVENSPPYTVNWDTTSYSDGLHTITAIAHDGSNNAGIAKNVILFVNNRKSSAVFPGFWRLY